MPKPAFAASEYWEGKTEVCPLGADASWAGSWNDMMGGNFPLVFSCYLSDRLVYLSTLTESVLLWSLPTPACPMSAPGGIVSSTAGF